MEARSTAIHRCEELSARRVQLSGNNVEHQVVHTTDILFTTYSPSRRAPDLVSGDRSRPNKTAAATEITEKEKSPDPSASLASLA